MPLSPDRQGQTSSTSLPGEKSRGPLQNVAFLAEDLVLTAQPFEFGRHVSLRRANGRVRLAVSAAPDPAGQRRQANTQILRDRSPRPAAGQCQPDRLVLERLREPLLLSHRGLLASSETLHFSGASPATLS